MQFGLNLLAGVLISTSAPAFKERVFQEGKCVFDEVMAGAQDVATAARTCSARYGWSETSKKHSIGIGFFTTKMLAADREVAKAGVDTKFADLIIDQLTPAERAAIVEPDGTTSTERKVVLDKIARLISEAKVPRDALNAAMGAVLHRGAVTWHFHLFETSLQATARNQTR